jgi:hypothetical protein
MSAASRQLDSSRSQPAFMGASLAACLSLEDFASHLESEDERQALGVCVIDGAAIQLFDLNVQPIAAFCAVDFEHCVA